jgi:threonine/homoserine/homoserine lactone efflux protein
LILLFLEALAALLGGSIIVLASLGGLGGSVLFYFSWRPWRTPQGGIEKNLGGSVVLRSFLGSLGGSI